MASSRRFLSGYAAPVTGLLAVAALLGWLCRSPGFDADKLVLVGIAGLLGRLLWQRTRRTNLLIARFVSALDHGDLAQAFRTAGHGVGLDELGQAFDKALMRLRAERLRISGENRFAAALVNETPTPLLTVDDKGRVHLANKAARRLFYEADGRPAEAFSRYGSAFARALTEARPGERRVCGVRWNGLSQRAILAVALADRQGALWRILSVQIIQPELDAAEMATQADLVRVLTHEIMNSLTPVTSLAASAVRVLDEAESGGGDAGADALADARLAVGALSRRAEAISDFVRAYRHFSESPSVTIARFEVRPWLDDIVKAFQATDLAEPVVVRLEIPTGPLLIDGDPTLLGQVLLNLLKNAGQACCDVDSPTVLIAIATNEAGRVLLSVSDNGSGVPAGQAEEIFLPFFTTKADGSGVGLSFARQIVLLHGGAIGLAASRLGGATFQIVL